MAQPNKGVGGAVGLGVELTYGTAVTVDRFRPGISLEGSRNAEFKPRPSLRSSLAGVHRPLGFYQSAENPSGRFEIECTYENIGTFLHAALGASSSAGGGPYTHTYILGALESYTLENFRGTAANSEKFEGAMLGRTSWRATAGGILVQSSDWIAETGAARGSPTSISYGSGDTLVQARHAGSLSWNSVNYSPNDIELMVDHALERRPYIGSLFTREPAPGEVKVTFRATVDYDVDTPYTAHVAGTQADGSLAFTSGSSSLTINFQNAIITKVSEPVNSAGTIRQSIEWDCYGDGTDHGVSIVVVNGNSSATAN